ncbi:MAG: hypothetical protein IKN18_01660 [Neisseriaceae bacterium]|nr:hypothetical protein [Neisseriaceae bacterium]
MTNQNIKVGGFGQRLLMGIFLPIIPIILISLFPDAGGIKYVLMTIGFCIFPLVVFSLVTETLQEHKTLWFFIFSILILLAYLALTILTVWLIIFFWAIVPGCLITLPLLRWHYLHCKKKKIITHKQTFKIKQKTLPIKQ